MGSVVVYGPVAGTGGALAGLVWLGLFAAFIALIAWAVTGMVDHRHPVEVGGAGARSAGPAAPMGAVGSAAAPYTEDEALVAARARYASGAIDRDQYFQVVEDLTGIPRPQPSAEGFAQPITMPADTAEPAIVEAEAPAAPDPE